MQLAVKTCKCCGENARGNDLCDTCWDILNSVTKSAHNAIKSRGKVNIKFTPLTDIIQLTINASSQDEITQADKVLLQEYTLLLNLIGLIGDIVIVDNNVVIQALTPPIPLIITHYGSKTNRSVKAKFHLAKWLLNSPKITTCPCCASVFHSNESYGNIIAEVCAKCWCEFDLHMKPLIDDVLNAYKHNIFEIHTIRGRCGVFIHAFPSIAMLSVVAGSLIEVYNAHKFTHSGVTIEPVKPEITNDNWEGYRLSQTDSKPTYSVKLAFLVNQK
ncbi:hypothetical protein E24_00242 [Faustovirus]|nr:hypothetical protein PRJ_Fausto_00227 [Faustovirus]AMN83170.1 hypothetical protein E24_00242 [Faustovirus]AMN84150.1 hypothetical protein D5a_00240 [Faustovirus]AMN85139.1 hypothetical protein E23_00241 [Faustovirus]QBR99135.1 hypothetical protein [Faustovirus mariensis]